VVCLTRAASSPHALVRQVAARVIHNGIGRSPPEEIGTTLKRLRDSLLNDVSARVRLAAAGHDG
jgi:hypothetical protein